MIDLVHCLKRTPPCCPDRTAKYFEVLRLKRTRFPRIADDRTADHS